VRAAAAAAAVLLAAGCGGSDGSGTPAEPRGPLTVEEALRSEADGPLRVRGTLIVQDDVRLCSAILESHPPQCGQPSLRVVGLDFLGVSNMEQAKGVRWTSREVTLVGEVEDGVLTVSG
jgi:hypothetical protein